MKIFLFLFLCSLTSYSLTFIGCESHKIFCEGRPIGMPDEEASYKKYGRFFTVDLENQEACFGMSHAHLKTDEVTLEPLPTSISLNSFEYTIELQHPGIQEPQFQLVLAQMKKGQHRLFVSVNLAMGQGTPNWQDFFEPIEGHDTHYRWRCE